MDRARVISMYRGSIANILVNITRIIVSTGQISSIGRLGSIPLATITTIHRGAVSSIGWSSRVAMAYTSRSSVSISSISRNSINTTIASIYSGAVSSTSIG